MEPEELDVILKKHQKWLKCEPDGERAKLWNANLRNADLRGANIDYSCWPLWCGGLDVIVDKRIAAQLAYHFCRILCDDEEVKAAQKALYPLANQFRRVDEYGILED